MTPFLHHMRLCLYLLLMALPLTALAEINIESGKTYYITCNQDPAGYVALGENHGSNFLMTYVSGNTPADDGYWIITKDGEGYTIRNAKSQKYVSWSDDYDALRNMNLVTQVQDDNQRWTLEEYNGSIIIMSLANPNYVWNTRSSKRVACYQSTNYNDTNNQYNIYDQNGNSVLTGESSGGTDPSDTPDDDQAVSLLSPVSEISFDKYYVLLNGGHSTYLFVQNEYGYYGSTIYPIMAELSSNVEIDGKKYSEVAKYLFKFADVDGKSISIQSALTGEYFGELVKGDNLGTTTTADYSMDYGTVDGETNWFWFHQSYSGYYMDCNNPSQVTTFPYPTMAGWTDLPTSRSSNSAWQIIEVSVGGSTLVESITLDHTALRIPVGQSYKVNATVLPANASRKTVTWSTSNASVASILDGTITAESEGTATITVSATDGSGQYATCTVEAYTPGGGTSVESDTLFLFKANGSLDAFPTNVIASQMRDDSGNLTITTTDGQTFSYKSYEIEQTANTFSGHETKLPRLTSFKFNNKYNDQLQKDVIYFRVEGQDTIYTPPSQFELNIRAAIGKRLTASFKTDSEDAGVYIDGVEQVSKRTRNRYEGGVVRYTVAPHSFKIYSTRQTTAQIWDISDPDNPIALTQAEEESYAWKPYGRNYDINITWATDNTTSEYRVPKVYITTDDGLFITSKTTYKSATISIDGAGVFDDFPETPVNIRGRGNSSWSSWASPTATGRSNPKNPYRLKFASKQKILGMTKGKNWVLLANKQTGSMTTNAIAMKLADMVKTVAANHIVPVELYINGDYRGSYNMTEKVGFSNNSVDLPDETNAILLQLDTYSDTWQYNEPTYGVTTNVMEPDLDDESINNYEFADNHFTAIQECWNTFTSTISDGDYYDRIDIDAFVRAMLVTDLTRNQELKHPKSWYVYNENALTCIDQTNGQWVINEASPYVFGPVWDFDWSYGYDGTGQYFVYNAETDIFSNVSYSNKGAVFFRDMMHNSEKVKKAYYSLWKKFMESGKLTELLEYCDDYYDYAKESFDHDATVWGRSDYASLTTQAKTWLKRRAEYIYNELEVYDLSDEEVELLLGDVNEDGYITTADVACALNHILGIENDNFEFRQADIDHNDIISMKDIAMLLNMIPVQDSRALQSRRLRLQRAEAMLVPEHFEASLGRTAMLPLSLTVNSGTYSAIQFDITLPDGVEPGEITLPETLSQYAATITWTHGNTWRATIYSSADNALPQGKTTLHLELTPSKPLAPQQRVIALTNTLIVDSQAEDHCLTTSNATFGMTDSETSVTTLDDESSSTTTVPQAYDLSGRKLKDTAPRRATHGVYIVNGRKVVR